MATATEEPKGELLMLDETGLANFSKSDAGIAELANKYLPLEIKGVNDSNGFKLVHAARMDVRARRIGVEKIRKDLKANALDFGKRVDAEAKRITALLEPIEEHLDAQETAYEDAKAEIKRQAEVAKQAALQARIDALWAVDVVLPVLQVGAFTDDEFAAILNDAKAEHAAKLEKIEAERIERERIEAEAAAARKAEDERLAKERAELEAEKARHAAEQAEQKRIADDAAAKQRAEAEEAARKEAEELRPDKERLIAFAETLLRLEVPKVKKPAAVKLREEINSRIAELSAFVEASARKLR